MGKKQIIVCGSTNCRAGKSLELLNYFNDKIKENNLEDKIEAIQSGCMGLCEYGPMVQFDGVYYAQISLKNVAKIFDEHILKGEIVPTITLGAVKGQEFVPFNERAFFANQERVALRNCGKINPESIFDYMNNKGYDAIKKVLAENKPSEIVSTILESGLRGKGGAGFLTGEKWKMAASQQSEQKYIICNGDEGDPGAYMNRAIMEGDPHSIIEAMLIAGFAVGANYGYLYVRYEYLLAIKHLDTALKAAHEKGLLGKNILGSGFDFDIEIRQAPGAFISGEESALINTIEGKRGEPTEKPPYPAIQGLFGKPTVINNVETLASIPSIILNGANWYNSFGLDGSNGTKIFALSGDITTSGLVEVPFGKSIQSVIDEMGGGIKSKKAIKAVHTAGPSGGVIPAELFDTKIGYDSFKELGTMIGSGGLTVLNENDCMVENAKTWLQFSMDESCGKCTPCRIGTKKLYEMLEKFTLGTATAKDLEEVEALSEFIMQNSLCGLGQCAPIPVLSTLKHYREEYTAHIDGKCPAASCKELIEYKINDNCVGCTICARNCPVNCISGERKEKHLINPAECIKCGVCYEKCPYKAIDVA